MTRTSQIIVIAVTSMILLFSACGCQEDQQTESISPKKAKLLASENMKLEEQISEQNKQIRDLEQKLELCQQDNKKLKAESQKSIEQMTAMLLQSMGKENAKLKEEIKQLKAKIQELEQK